MDFKEFKYSDVEATDVFEWTYYDVEILHHIQAKDLNDDIEVTLEPGECYDTARVDWECESPNELVFSRGACEYGVLVETIIR